jgi:hypothetical protein
LFFFYCILAYYKSQDKFSATEQTLHIVKIYQKGILYYLYQIEKNEVLTEALVKSVTDSINQVLPTILHWMTKRNKFLTVQDDEQKQQMQK